MCRGIRLVVGQPKVYRLVGLHLLDPKLTNSLASIEAVKYRSGMRNISTTPAESIRRRSQLLRQHRAPAYSETPKTPPLA